MDFPYYLGGESGVNFAPEKNAALKLAGGNTGYTEALKSYLMGLAMNGSKKQDKPTSNQVDALNAGKGPVNSATADKVAADNSDAFASYAGYKLDPQLGGGNSALNLKDKNSSY